ncbi:MAG: hypothetical protein VYD45_08895, partial [Pseudomonadota bacterium]|nr:hypothetical protein [Pseudomonadota bacterium]
QQVIAVRPDRSDRKALPKGQKRINIVHKNAGLWMCLFALTSSIKPAFLFLSFPGFREEPFFMPETQPGRGAAPRSGEQRTTACTAVSGKPATRQPSSLPFCTST